jgi:hypothetical protein
MAEKIFALSYEHKHGTDLSLWRDEPAATKALAAIVRRGWSEAYESATPDDGLSVRPPADDQRAIDLYFQVMGEERNTWEPESYWIKPLEIRN